MTKDNNADQNKSRSALFVLSDYTKRELTYTKLNFSVKIKQNCCIFAIYWYNCVKIYRENKVVIKVTI